MNVFKKLRMASGLSQNEVAEALGYSTNQFISNWDRSISTPPYKACKILSKLYKVPLNEFVDILDEVKLKQFIERNKSQKKRAGL